MIMKLIVIAIATAAPLRAPSAPLTAPAPFASASSASAAARVFRCETRHSDPLTRCRRMRSGRRS